jgi:hypothetical protein
MFLMRMTTSPVSLTFIKNAHRLGQQAPPQARYPAGQADTDVTTHVAAKIVTRSLKIMMVRMASLPN